MFNRSTWLETLQMCFFHCSDLQHWKSISAPESWHLKPLGKASGLIWWAEKCELEIKAFEHWTQTCLIYIRGILSLLEVSLWITLCVCNVDLRCLSSSVKTQLFLLLRDVSISHTMLSHPLNAKPSSRVIPLGHLKRKLFTLDECYIYVYAHSENWKLLH